MLQVDKTHPVFADHGGDLERCIPCILHGDEGVGHRRKPVLQILWGSLLRLGVGAMDRLFLVTTCPHKYYSKFNQGIAAGNRVTDRLLIECGRSACRAYYQGIHVEGYGQFYLVFLGVAGDHPFQTKAFTSMRHHLKTEICPHCLANTSTIPFEDYFLTAAWRRTVYQSVPWNVGHHPPMSLVPRGDHPSFIKWDLMHMIPHGCARNFCGSIICMMVGPMGLFTPEPGVEKLKERVLSAAYSSFHSWLCCVGKSARDLKEFTPENLGWVLNRDFPDGSWKANDTTLLVGWLLDLFGTMPWEWQEPMGIAYCGLQSLDNFLRLCYTGDRCFLDAKRQTQARDDLFAFLKSYADLAKYWYSRKWTLFGFTPKYHYSMHWHDELHMARLSNAAYAWNPGAFATPMMEDMVGIVSRISRSVHAGSVPISTIRKYLVECSRRWA